MEKSINVSDTENAEAAIWEQIRQAYGFGDLQSTPQPISGGLQHRMWRMETSRGAFAVKLLHPRCAADDECRRRCLRGERVARRAAEAGLPAAAALDGPEGPLQRFGLQVVLCYRWEPGVILPPTPVLPAQAGLIGALLGRLHTLNLPSEDVDPPAHEWFSERHWQGIAQRVRERELSIAPALVSALPDLLSWNDATRSAAANLSQDWVVSHRDLDQKNVLWADAATACLLDWEAAGRVHPALEVMGAALNWAGQSAGPPEEAVFRAFLSGYRSGAHLNAVALRHAATAVLGKWLVWLEVCLRCALEASTTAEQDASLGSAAHALATLHRLAAATPERLAWCDAR